MRPFSEILDDLAGDFGTWPSPGDTSGADVDRGLRVVAEVHRDDMPASTYINDCDVWGKVSEYAYDYWRDGRKPRPQGFDGAARKIQVDRGYWMWWQPFDGFLKLSPEEQRKEQQTVRDLLELGFLGVTVTLLEALRDSFGNDHWVAIDNEGLWGIDSLENGYIREVLNDLVLQVLHYAPEVPCATSK